jgi:hypothetical protein
MCRGRAGAKLRVEYRAKPAYLHRSVNKETKKVEEVLLRLRCAAGELRVAMNARGIDYL